MYLMHEMYQINFIATLLSEVVNIVRLIRNNGDVNRLFATSGLMIRNLKCLDKSPSKYVIVRTQL